MFRPLDGRVGHYALLLAGAAVLFLPNLGAPSLWDIDEGHNAEAAREMLASGNWVVPTFNFQLRVDKPALLYWLQMAAYRSCGVGELAARLPSALASLAAVLVTYELGRLLFGAGTGLLAGLVLASAALFCGSAHFANPDALLNALTVLTFFLFWHGWARSFRPWFALAGVSTGLAVLAKGPVGLVLPAAVIGLFLLQARQLRRLWDYRLVLGGLVFALVALPWYVWVGAETKADFLRGFFWTHNVGRYLSPMERHGGPLYYYLVALALGFVPWSAFLGLAVWHSVKEESAARRAHAFLWCWIAVYLVFFSLAGTKLPNYILPIYPAVALLTARFLDRWRRGVVQPPAWAVHGSLACLALLGVGAAVGFLLAGGAVEVPFLRGRRLAGLENLALLGAVPVLGAAAAWWCLHRQRPGGLVVAVTTTAVLFVGALAAWGSVVLDAHKAPRPLVLASRARQLDREIRIGCYQYFQPSLVFYCRREVSRLADEGQALEFLRWPVPVYLFLPAPVWAELHDKVRGSHRLVGRHHDLYRGCEVVVVTNF
jgi:4-amino-4-deoxy-L-arabinose transferase-like glycosyltransferase